MNRLKITPGEGETAPNTNFLVEADGDTLRLIYNGLMHWRDVQQRWIHDGLDPEEPKVTEALAERFWLYPVTPGRHKVELGSEELSRVAMLLGSADRNLCLSASPANLMLAAEINPLHQEISEFVAVARPPQP